MLKLLSLLISTNTGKASLATIGSGGLLTLILGLHGDIKEDVDRKLQEQRLQITTEVDLKFETIKSELKSLDRRQDDANKMLRDIHGHLLKK